MTGPNDESNTRGNDAEMLARQFNVKRGRSMQAGPGAAEECGDFGIRIARDGTWYYLGSPIGRKPLVKLFSTVLRRDDDGGFWLVTPVERGRIQVDDAPFVAVAMEAAGTGRNQTLTFTTNLDQTVTAGPEHPIRMERHPDTGEPSPYVTVRDRLDALIARPVFYDLVELGEEAIIDGRRELGIWSGGRFFTLGPVES
jgi:hypothetical protein